MITILSVDHSRENFTVIKYKKDDIFSEACIFHFKENVRGGLKRTAAEYEEITRKEADILLDAAEEFEKNKYIHPIFEAAIMPFTAFSCPQCGGKMYYNHCTKCDQRGI